jgi:hypothetical protein
MENGINKYICEAFEINVPAYTTQEQLVPILAEKINDLIVNDFSSLVRILYRIDVSEQKLKTLLKENTDADAGKIIAVLIIERQLQKLTSRKQAGKEGKNIIDENESW